MDKSEISDVIKKYQDINNDRKSPYRLLVRNQQLLFEDSPVFNFFMYNASMQDVLTLVRAAYYEGWLQGKREYETSHNR